MVASVDGQLAVDGKASGLGTATDRGAMRTLRSKADAVMVGGGTVRAEKLALGLDADDPRPGPLAVILTNTGGLPLESNLVRDPRQDVLVLLSARADENSERALRGHAEVRRMREAGAAIDLSEAMRVLKTEYGTETLLCEGGPTLTRALISSGLADELFLTLAPRLIGQASKPTPATEHGPPPETKAKALRLISAHQVGDELFTRYAIDPP